MDTRMIKKITNRIENIDGENLYIIDSTMNKALNKLLKISNANRNSAVFDLLRNHIKFIYDHPNFGLAFRPFLFRNTTKWVPCTIYKLEGIWKRVQLQNVHCLNCNWTGEAANPTSPELYELMTNRFEILEKMWELPFCVCPKCGGKLSTQAIWIEGKESEEDLKE